MRRFFRWLFGFKDEPQALYSDLGIIKHPDEATYQNITPAWDRLEEVLLQYELEAANRDWAQAKRKLDACKPTDARRGAYQQDLKDAVRRSLAAENELRDLGKGVVV